MASLARRQLLILGGATALSACGKPASPITAATTPPLDMDRMNREVGAVAARVRPGVRAGGGAQGRGRVRRPGAEPA